MKLRYSLFLQILSLWLLQSSHAQIDCNHIITTHGAFDRILTASENYSLTVPLLPNPSYLEAALGDLKIVDDQDRALFTHALELKPLFDSGIVYESIVAESILRDYKGSDGIKMFLNNFNILSASEKTKIVNGVLENMQFVFYDSVGISNLSLIAKSAKRFRMSEDEISAYLRNMQTLEKTNYDEVKLIILDLMRNPSEQLVNEILKYRKNFTKPSAFEFRTSYYLRPPLTFTTDADGLYESVSLREYLLRLNLDNRISFINKNWNKMNTQSLRSWRASLGHMFLPGVKKKMGIRIELLEAKAELTHAEAVRATIGPLEEKIKALNQQLQP